MQFAADLIALFSLPFVIRSASAARVLAFSLIVFGLVGNALWEWGRVGKWPWSGLPTEIVLSDSQADFTRSLLYLAATAVLVGAALARPIRSKPSLSRWQAPSATVEVAASWVHGLNAVVAVVWLMGQGPSLARRSVYLAADGSEFAARAAALMLLPTLFLTAWTLVLVRRQQAPALVAWLVAWCVLQYAVATRITLIVILLLGVALAFRARRASHAVTPVLVVVVSAIATIASAAPVHAQRYDLHGLTPMVESVLSGEFVDYLAPSAVYDSARGLATSVGAGFPIVGLTAERPIPPAAFARIIDPRPQAIMSSEGVTVGDLVTRYETLWPWRVVPTSALGELFAVGGHLLVSLVFAAAGFLLQTSQRNLGAGRIIAYLGYGLAVLLFLTSIQYGGRQFARLLEFTGALAVASMVLRTRLSHARVGKRSHA